MERVLWALLQNVLEATALAALVAVAARLLRPSAAARHLLWALVLVKLILPAPWSQDLSLSGGFSFCVGRLGEGLPAIRPPSEAERPAPEIRGPLLEQRRPTFTPEEEESAAAQETAAVEVRPAVEVAPLAPHETGAAAAPEGNLAAAVVLSLWGAAFLLAAIREVRKIAGFRARLRGARQAPEEVALECAAMARRLGLARAPRVALLGGPVPPMVFALGRPVVVLPEGLLETGGRQVVRAVLAHELAHIRRGDPLFTWLDLAGRCLYPWLPTFWWARGEAEMAADEACDGWAAEALESPGRYAEALLAVLEWLHGRGGPALPALGRALGERDTVESALERRFTMILRERSSHRVSWAAGLCLAAAFVLALPASSSRLGADEVEEGNAGANVPRIQIELQPAQAQPAQPPAGAQAVVLDPAVLLPPQATPAPAGGAPAESDTEKRLRKLEATLEKVLQLLEAREAGPPRNATVRLGPARVSRGTTARIEARTGAAALDPEEPSAEAALPPAPPPRWAPAATARPAPPALPARPGQPAAGGAPPVPPEPPVRVTSQMSSRAWRLPNTPRPRRFDLNLEPGTLSPEKQKEVEDLVASYQDRMAKLLEEHRLALRKALEGVLEEEEIEEIERQGQPAPVRIDRRVQPPTPAKR